MGLQLYVATRIGTISTVFWTDQLGIETKSVGVGTASTEIGTIVTWDCRYMIMIRTISNKISLHYLGLVPY